MAQCGGVARAKGARPKLSSGGRDLRAMRGGGVVSLGAGYSGGEAKPWRRRERIAPLFRWTEEEERNTVGGPSCK